MFRVFKTPDGVLLYDRMTGLNILLDSFKGCPNFDRPLYAQIQVTNHCNLRCSFCSQTSDPSNQHWWKPNDLFALCKYLDEWGLCGVAIGGGEPFTYPHLSQLLHRIYDSTGLDVSVTSNGLLITDDDLQTLAGHIGEIRISCWSKSDTSKLKRLLGKGVPIAVNTILFKDGIDRVKEVTEEAKRLGVEDLLILDCKPVGRAGIEMVPEQKDVEDLANYINDLGIQVKVDSDLGFRMKGLVPYVGPWTTNPSRGVICITHDGSVKPNSFSSQRKPINGLDDIKSSFQEWRNQYS